MSTAATLGPPAGADEVPTPATEPGPPPLPKHIPGLDGIRGVAILATLIGHLPYGDWTIRFQWLRGDWFGVSMFFTLSGFLITSHLITERERNGRVSMSDFWSRRAKRLLPALFMSLVLIMFLTTIHVMPVVPHFGGEIITTVFYVKNIAFLYFHQQNSGNLFQFWSLSIEEQFYFVFPVLFVLAWQAFRRRSAWVFAATMLGLELYLYHLRGTPDRWNHAYFGPPRFGDILAGVLLAFLVTSTGFRSALTKDGFRRALQVIGVVALVTEAILLNRANLSWVSYWQWAQSGTLTVSILIMAMLVPGPATSVLSIRPLRWVGKISYGAYLYHVAIYYVLTPERTGIHSNGLLSVVRITVVLLVSWASFHFIEQPLRQRAEPSGRRLALAYAAPAAVVVLLALTLPFPEPTRRPPAVSAAAFATTNKLAGKSAHHVVIVGDELAQASLPGLHQVVGADPKQYWVADHLAANCPFVGPSAISLDGHLSLPDHDCRWLWLSYGSLLANERPQTAVVLMGIADLADRLMPDHSWSHLGNADANAQEVRALDKLAMSLERQHPRQVIWYLLPPGAAVKTYLANSATAAAAPAASTTTTTSTTAAPGTSAGSSGHADRQTVVVIPAPPTPPTTAELRRRAALLDQLMRVVAARHPGIELRSLATDPDAALQPFSPTGPKGPEVLTAEQWRAILGS